MAAFLGPLLGTGISALAGLFGAKKQSTSDTTSNSTTTPDLSNQQQQLLQSIIAGGENQYNQATDLSGYQAQGLQNINNNANLQSKTVQNLMASRGLSYSPAAVNAIAQPAAAKQSQSSQFENSIPLLQQQLKQSSLQQLMQSFGLIPTASTTSGTSNTTQTGTVNPVGAALSGGGAGMYSSGLSGLLGNLFGGGNGVQSFNANNLPPLPDSSATSIAPTYAPPTVNYAPGSGPN